MIAERHLRGSSSPPGSLSHVTVAQIPATLSVMLGEQEAIVMEVIPFDLHGVTYYDVTVAFPDRSVEQARLGPEGVPDGLQPGEQILATRVGNMVISLRRQ